MPYKIEQKKNGVIKRFSGEVTFEDLVRSEQDVAAHPDFSALQFVISDYTQAQYHGINKEQRDEINALRVGAYMTNSRIKYAFVIHSFSIQTQMADAISEGEMLFEAKFFDSIEQANAWVGSST